MKNNYMYRRLCGYKKFPYQLKSGRVISIWARTEEQSISKGRRFEVRLRQRQIKHDRQNIMRLMHEDIVRHPGTNELLQDVMCFPEAM